MNRLTIGICTRNILWWFVHLKMINNVSYGPQGLYLIPIQTHNTLIVCLFNTFRPILYTKSMYEFYTYWDSTSGLHWQVDSINEEVWKSIDSILTI